jgi:uncharacterized protein (DUF362 family)
MRGLIHINIGEKLVDLTDFIKPELTVIDATRVLMRNGPTGGDLEDVVRRDTVFASPDPVLADAFACQFVDRDPLSVTYLQQAAKRKLGQIDVSQARIQTIKLS